MCVCSVAQSCPPLCNPMDFNLPGSSVNGTSPGQNTGVGCHSLLQEIFPIQGLNPGFPHCRQILYHLSHKGSLIIGYATYIKRTLKKKKYVKWVLPWQTTFQKCGNVFFFKLQFRKYRNKFASWFCNLFCKVNYSENQLHFCCIHTIWLLNRHSRRPNSGLWYFDQDTGILCSPLGDRPILSEYQCLGFCSHLLVHSKPLTLLHWYPFIQWSSVRAKRQATFWSSPPCINRSNTTSEREVSVPVIQHCSYLCHNTVSQLSQVMLIIVTWGAV